MTLIARAADWLASLFYRRSRSVRHIPVFSLSDAELSARGYDRENLVRSYIGGFGHR